MNNEYSEFAGDFQLSLLSLYVREPDQALDVIEPRYFTNIIHAEIAGVVKKAYQGRDISSLRLTKASLWTLVWEQVRKRKTKYEVKPVYRKVVRDIFRLHLTDRDILLDQARKFARAQAYRAALVKAEKDVNSGNYGAVAARFLDIQSQERTREKRSSELPIHNLHRFISEETSIEGQENHVVYPIVPRRGGVLLYGLPKELKSWFGAALAIDASCGRKALGFFDVPRPVRTLFVQVEDPEFLTRQRMRELTMGQGKRKAVGMLKIIPRCPLNLMDAVWLEELTGVLKRFKPELLVLDVFRRLFRGNVADSKETAEFLVTLDKLRDTYGCAIVLVHHARKGESAEMQTRALGSVNLTAWADVLIYTSGKHRLGTASVANLQIETKSAFFEETDLELAVDSEAWPMVQVLKKGHVEIRFLEEIISDCPGINQKELEQKSKIPEKHLRKLLRNGEEQGIWYSKRGDRKTLCYFLPKKGNSTK